MKKILALILALVLCLSSVALLASCKDPSQGGTEPGPGTATYDVEAAKDYVKSLYTKYLSNNKTNGDFKLVNQVKQGDVVYTVTWTSDNEAVKVVETEGEATVTIDVPEKPAEDVNYTLKATVTAPDGATASLEFKLLVPKFDQDAGFGDYIAAEKDDAVTVEGIVTSITSKSQGGKYNNLYLQDLNGAGGYYIYSIKDGVDPVADLGIKLGMTVSVSGTKDIYNGVHEVKDAVVTVTDTTEKEIEFIDLTDKALAAENEEDFDLVNYQGCWVTIKGVVIGGVYADQYYYYWSIGNVDSYTRLALSCGLPEATIDAIKNGHTAHKGYTATVKGIVNVYNGVFYLVPLGEDAFVYGDKLEVTDDQKVADEKADLTVKDKFNTESSLTLPLVGATHEDVTIAWTSSDTSVLTIAADGKVTFVAAGTATLTATITANGVVDTKTFEVTVEAGAGLTALTPVVGTEYRLGFTQANLNKIYYLTGTKGGYNNLYCEVTENFADAAVFFIEETKDGYYLACTVNGAKKYLNMVTVETSSGTKVNAEFQDAASTVYTYNETLKTLEATVNGAAYGIGTYQEYYQPGPSKTSYADNFFVHFVTSAGSVVDPEDPVTPPAPPAGNTGLTPVKPVVGTEYRFGFTQTAQNKIYYLTGVEGGYNNYYTAVTENWAEAAVFGIEETTGGYYLFCKVNGAKKYLNMVASGEHVNPKFQDTASTVYTYSETLKTFVSTVNNAEYAFATYGNYYNPGPSKTSNTDSYYVYFVTEAGSTDTPVTPPVGGDPVTPPEVEGETIKIFIKGVYITDEMYLYTSKNKWQLKTTSDPAKAAVWTMIENEDGSVSFISPGGKYLFADGTHAKLVDTQEANTLFVLENATGGQYIRCKTAKYNGKAQYLEYYSSYLTCYGMGSDKTIYTFSFIPVGEDSGLPEEDTPLTSDEISDVLSSFPKQFYTTEKYVITGTIVSITNKTSGILTIKDVNGKTFKINATFYPYYAGSSTTNRWNTIPEDQRPGIGDTVSFYGVIGKNSSGVVEMKNASIIDGWVRHTCDMAPATCEDPATCKLCGKQVGLTYVHDYDEDGICVNCGAEKPVENVPTPEEPVKVVETFDFSKNTTAANTTALTQSGLNTILQNCYSGEETFTTGSTVTYVYPGNTSGGDKTGKDFIKMGKSGNGGKFTIDFGDKKVEKVVINCQTWNSSKIGNVSVNGSAQQAANVGSATDLEFVLATQTGKLEFATTERVFVFSITVYFA